MSVRRTFVSDLHMSVHIPSPSFPNANYNWLSPSNSRRFLEFLSWYDDTTTPAADTQLILLGDMCDSWVFPHDVSPPTVAQVLTAPDNAAIVNKLNAIAATRAVFWMAGNHDMELTAADLAAAAPNVRFGGNAALDPQYVSGRLRAEHGSAHTMFNAPDPSQRAKLPIGYFVSRLSATAMARNGKSVRPAHVIDDLLESLGGADLAERVLEAMAEEAGLHGTATIVMPPHLWGGVPVTVDQVKAQYRDLYSRWKAQKGAGLAFKALVAEIGWLEDVADSLCKKGGTNVVVFGHSHDAELDKDAWIVDDRIYANCGAWTNDVAQPSFVVAEKIQKDEACMTQVDLCGWMAGSARVTKTESVCV